MNSEPHTLEHEMKALMNRLLVEAERHNFDFLHPEVLAVSQELDVLIVKLMGRE